MASFAIICVRWLSTVLTLIFNVPAISFSDIPEAMWRRTSICLAVSRERRDLHAADDERLGPHVTTRRDTPSLK